MARKKRAPKGSGMRKPGFRGAGVRDVDIEVTVTPESPTANVVPVKIMVAEGAGHSGNLRPSRRSFRDGDLYCDVYLRYDDESLVRPNQPTGTRLPTNSLVEHKTRTLRWVKYNIRDGEIYVYLKCRRPGSWGLLGVAIPLAVGYWPGTDYATVDCPHPLTALRTPRKRRARTR
jgi:hypothetical protein